jgi:hypothetical protein
MKEFSVDDFRGAFQRIQSKLSDKQFDMLQKHYHAPDRKITARQMAEAVGYSNFRVANSQYGKVGGLLCDVLGHVPEGPKLSVLVRFDSLHKEWIWEMKEPAAQALGELDWILRVR